MKQWHLIVIIVSCVLSAILICANLSTDKSDKEKTSKIVIQHTNNKTTEQEYKAVFEVVSNDDEISEDIEVYPDNFNGEFIEDDGKSYENLAKPELSSKSEITLDNRNVISMSDNDAWSYFTDGIFTSYPAVPYGSIKQDLRDIYSKHAKQITVKVWFWKNPDDNTDMRKVTRTIKLTVHDKIAPLYENIFADIYNDKNKPVINIRDSGMGTWVLRGKNHSDYNTLSSHALGTAIDINPSTGSYMIDGTLYGNSYGATKMPYNVWKTLPETHTKYHVLYEDCPIVMVFKSYGFYWGGDWTSGTDCMHLAFLGDGSGRKVGYANYLKYKR